MFSDIFFIILSADTLLITATLMFGCYFALIVEGFLPEDTWYGLVVSYSISVSLSFFFLFLCIWFTLKFQSRMSDFNIYNKCNFSFYLIDQKLISFYNSPSICMWRVPHQV